MATDLKQILIRLTPEQHEALRKLAFDTKLTMAEHIRRAIKDYMEKNIKNA